MSVTADLIDVRTVAPPQRHPLIFGTFDGLHPGEALLLVNDHDPKPLFYQFQAESAGEFTIGVIPSPKWYGVAPA